MGVIVENVDTELNRIDFTFEDEFENMPSRKPGLSRYGSGKPSKGKKYSPVRKPGRKGRPKSFGGRSGRGGGRGRS
jgi:hypothetical protein